MSEDDTGCYICQPDNPDAAEEGCSACERDFWVAVGVITPDPPTRPIPPGQG